MPYALSPTQLQPHVLFFWRELQSNKNMHTRNRVQIRPCPPLRCCAFSTAIACLSRPWAFLAKFRVLQPWRGSSTSSSSDMTAHACPFQYPNINTNNINSISIISTSILSACLIFRGTFQPLVRIALPCVNALVALKPW